MCHLKATRPASRNMNYTEVLTVKAHRGMYLGMNEFQSNTENRSAVVNTLAVVGFIALIGGSMWLAVYSTRFVPEVVNRLGSAAVYLGSVFVPSPEPSLSVIPTPVASTTIPFSVASSTLSTNATTTPKKTTTPTQPKPVATTAGTKTVGTYQMNDATTTTQVLPSGLPDFIVTINAIGYLATSSADSFIASSTVPAGNRPAVKFTIKNTGTNTTGTWRFSASIPTQTAYIYQSLPQQSLAPGDSIDYILGFDQANRGAGQTISVTANFDRAVIESNSDNNSASAKITILGN